MVEYIIQKQKFEKKLIKWYNIFIVKNFIKVKRRDNYEKDKKNEPY